MNKNQIIKDCISILFKRVFTRHKKYAKEMNDSLIEGEAYPYYNTHQSKARISRLWKSGKTNLLTILELKITTFEAESITPEEHREKRNKYQIKYLSGPNPIKHLSTEEIYRTEKVD